MTILCFWAEYSGIHSATLEAVVRDAMMPQPPLSRSSTDDFGKRVAADSEASHEQVELDEALGAFSDQSPDEVHEDASTKASEDAMDCDMEDIDHRSVRSYGLDSDDSGDSDVEDEVMNDGPQSRPHAVVRNPPRRMICCNSSELVRIPDSGWKGSRYNSRSDEQLEHQEAQEAEEMAEMKGESED